MSLSIPGSSQAVEASTASNRGAGRPRSHQMKFEEEVLVKMLDALASTKKRKLWRWDGLHYGKPMRGTVADQEGLIGSVCILELLAAIGGNGFPALGCLRSVWLSLDCDYGILENVDRGQWVTATVACDIWRKMLRDCHELYRENADIPELEPVFKRFRDFDLRMESNLEQIDLVESDDNDDTDEEVEVLKTLFVSPALLQADAVDEVVFIGSTCNCDACKRRLKDDGVAIPDPGRGGQASETAEVKSALAGEEALEKDKAKKQRRCEAEAKKTEKADKKAMKEAAGAAKQLAKEEAKVKKQEEAAALQFAKEMQKEHKKEEAAAAKQLAKEEAEARKQEAVAATQLAKMKAEAKKKEEVAAAKQLAKEEVEARKQEAVAARQLAKEAAEAKKKEEEAAAKQLAKAQVEARKQEAVAARQLTKEEAEAKKNQEEVEATAGQAPHADGAGTPKPKRRRTADKTPEDPKVRRRLRTKSTLLKGPRMCARWSPPEKAEMYLMAPKFVVSLAYKAHRSYKEIMEELDTLCKTGKIITKAQAIEFVRAKKAEPSS